MMPRERLHDQITDRCLPEGTLGHAACHARDQEAIRALKALLRELEWRRDGYCPVCFPAAPPQKHAHDCRLKAALEGRDVDRSA